MDVSKWLAFIIVAAILFFATRLPTDFDVPNWYLKEKAQIDPAVADNMWEGFWSDDIVSKPFSNVTVLATRCAIGLWNYLAKSDAFRFVLAFVLVGFSAALGEDVYKSLKKAVRIHQKEATEAVKKVDAKISTETIKPPSAASESSSKNKKEI